MSDSLKVLGQAYPAAGVQTDLYTVPGGKSAQASVFWACNHSPSATTFRMSVAVAGAPYDAKQDRYYERSLAPYGTFQVVPGGTLAGTDVMRVQSANGMVSFALEGNEIT